MSVGDQALANPQPTRQAADAQVLVVDDDADLVDALVDFIEAVGYTATGVESGEQALAYLRRARVPPKVMLVDLRMPEMNGRQLLAQLDHGQAASMQVVLISAHDTDVAGSTGSAQVLTKPLDTDALCRLLAESCRCV